MSDYQVMPPLTEDEYEALKEDIRDHGVRVPVVEDGDGNVLDGHHRKRAWEELTALGFEVADYPIDVRPDLTEQEKYDTAISLNLQRRHLNRAGRKEVLSRVLKNTPERSNRWLAEIAGCDHKTVGSVRRDLEVRGEIPQPDRLHGKDGKGYVRMVYGSYEDEDRKRDQERKAETHQNVRNALRETPGRADEEIADEFDATTSFVADQRDDLDEHGPRMGDVFQIKPHTGRTAEQARADSQERREDTKRRKDAGELKTEDSRRAVEQMADLDLRLHLDHRNESRRITPQEAAEGYARHWMLEDMQILADKAQHDLEAVARLTPWMEEFAPALAREIDRKLKD